MKYIIMLAIFAMPLNLRADEQELQLMVFSASWCGPCQQMKKEVWPDKDIQRIIKDNKIEVFNIDIDKDSKTSSVFKVEAIPTVIIGYAYPDNKIKVLKRTIGYQDVSTIKQSLLTAVEQVKPEEEPLDYSTIPLLDYGQMIPALDYSF